jgi:hypothetical protein
MPRYRWLSLIAFITLAAPLTGCGRHKSNCCPPPPVTANAPCCPGGPGGPVAPVPPPPGPFAPGF